MFVVVPILLILPVAAVATLVAAIVSSYKRRIQQTQSQHETSSIHAQLSHKVDVLDQEVWELRKQINQLTSSIEVLNNSNRPNSDER